VRKAAARELARRLLLADDAARLVAEARASDVLPAAAPTPDAAAIANRLCAN
jgi:hypothetical protein